MPHDVAELERLKALRAELRSEANFAEPKQTETTYTLCEPNSPPLAPDPCSAPAPPRPKIGHLPRASTRFFNQLPVAALVHTIS
jgi:hypothetical protein